MTGLIVDGCAGPGGWSEAVRMLGLGGEVGVEWEASACATRAAAGHLTIRGDVAGTALGHLRGQVEGVIFSPPCVLFSSAGTRHGVSAIDLLSPAMLEVLAGHDVRERVRTEMAVELGPLVVVQNAKRRKPKDPAGVAREVRDVAFGASLVLEPARWVHELEPEWLACEQVPEVLPLWRALAHGLRQLGWSTWCGILDAADYGVPQNRTRAILMAHRTRAVTPPAPTHSPTGGEDLFGSLRPHVTMLEGLAGVWGLTDGPSPTVVSTSSSGGGPRALDGGAGARARIERARESGEMVEDMSVGFARRDDGRPGGDDGTGYRARDMRSIDRPAMAVTEKSRSWVRRVNTGMDWKEGEGRDAAQTIDVGQRPSPTVTGKSGHQWQLEGDPDDNTCVVDGCGRAARSRGMCNKHYERWRKYGDPLVTSRTPPGEVQAWLEAAVASRSRSECWPWPFAMGGDGYPYMRWSGHAAKATHVALELDRRPRPEPPGDNALHACDYPLCVNPDHLEWGTLDENNLQMIRRGRLATEMALPHTKLSNADVADISRRIGAGETMGSLAREYGVSFQAILNVKRGQRASQRPDRSWMVETGNNSMIHSREGSRAGDGGVEAYRRSIDRPAPTLDTNVGSKWVLVPGGLGYANGGDGGELPGVNRRTYDPEGEPAPTIAFGHDAANWLWQERFVRGEPENPNSPAERPATTVAGDYRIAQPGHKNDKASPDSPGRMQGAVRVTVQEAALLQSFRADYPWQGTATAAFGQVGNAVPPRLGAAVLGALLGVDWEPLADAYRDRP